MRVETEQEREVTLQLKQANDTVARLQQELRSAAVREEQLRKQLVDTKDQVTRHQALQKEVSEQLKQANDTVSRLQNELSDLRQRSAPLFMEKEMKDRDSKILFHIETYCRFSITNYIIYSVQ